MGLKELKAAFILEKGDRPKPLPRKEQKILEKMSSSKTHSHVDFVYALLALIYDGINEIELIKSKLKLMFTSGSYYIILEDQDIEEIIQIARQKEFLILREDKTFELTASGVKYVEINYHNLVQSSHFMRRYLNEKTVMLVSFIFLVILSTLKIIMGITLPSQGMVTEGIENLTDVIKIVIIAICIAKNRDRLGTYLVIAMMLLTGVSIIWSGINNLISNQSITPSVQAFVISISSIVINLMLSYLKGMVGRSSGNIALLSDSKDSQLNAYISIGVIIGFVFAIFKLYFVDALVGIFIAILILKEGVEMLVEMRKDEEDFDITEFKVKIDGLFDNRLDQYLLASIRRTRISKSHLLDDFDQGLELGKHYFEGFANFFFEDLNRSLASKRLNYMIKNNYIDVKDEEMFLTTKGAKYYYRSKANELRKKSEDMKESDEDTHNLKHSIGCISFIIILILIVVFAEKINIWLAG